jgi:hypothetical protein
MNCRDRRHDIVLFLYDELGETERNQLRRHLDECGACREFADTERTLYTRLTDDFSSSNMPPDLLVDCRRELSEGLDRLSTRWWHFPAQLFRLRWLEAAALVSIGLALGVYVSTGRAVNGSDPTAGSSSALPGVTGDAVVSNLRILSADPASGDIELAGEMVTPMRLQGRIDDTEFQQFVFGALRAHTNAGERLRIVELLAPNARDLSVQQALAGALLHDENPGVRLYALQALRPFAMQEEVRSALLYVLESDEIPGIRVAAIDALSPLTQDEALEEVVQEAVRADPNSYVRMRALQFVGR